MATALYRVKTGSGATALGTELLDTLATINDAYAKLLLLRSAIIQEKDGSAGNATDYVTPAAMFQFLDGALAVSSTVAMNAFTEIDSFVTTGGAALQQCCARFKQ